MIDIDTFVVEISYLFDKGLDYSFNEVLKSATIGYRATILKQEYDKHGKYPVGSEQSLCLPIISVKPIECCISDDLDCEVRRTTNKVPTAIRGNLKPEPYSYVGAANMGKAYNYAQPNEIEHIIKGTKYMNNIIFWSNYNGYIYIINGGGGKIAIKDVFSNPLELLELINCNGLPCLDKVYIEDDMRRIIKTMLLEEFSRLKKIPEDYKVELNSNE